MISAADFPSTYWILTAFLFLAGLCIGSFLNVCIWRIPRDESIVWPGSHCPSCNHALSVWENLPVISWLFLRGRCHHCHAPITARYLLVELLTALLFLALWLLHGPSLHFLIYATFTAMLLAGAFIDLEHLILPDRLTLGGMVLGLLCSVLWPPLQNQTQHLHALLQSLLGLALGYGILWLVALLGRLALKRDAMGMGDWKLLGAIGAFLGWPAVLFTIFVSSLSGTLIGLLFILFGKKAWQSRIPYGPHLVFAAILWMLCGPLCIQAYLRLFTF